mgnify:CR=1 FL=1
MGVGNEYVGRDDEVGVLMVTTNPTPITNTSVRLARHLGRPIQSEDFNQHSNGSPMSSTQFMSIVFQLMFKRPPPATTAISAVPVLARLDAGRWLADCPLGCRGAEKVSQADPFFLCLSCDSGEQWWLVEFPVNIKAIEREVVKRADVHSWAWLPGESLAALRRETRQIQAQG